MASPVTALARTEVAVAADVVAKLLEDGILSRDGRTLALACRALDIEPADVKAAHGRLQTIGYERPRRIRATEHLDQGEPPAPAQSAGQHGPGHVRPDRSETKVCSRCHIEKQLNRFDRSAKSKDGHNTWCKACKKAWAEDRYIQKADELLNELGLTFEVDADDEVCGLRCAKCNRSIEAGQTVHVDGAPVHDECPEDEEDGDAA